MYRSRPLAETRDRLGRERNLITEESGAAWKPLTPADGARPQLLALQTGCSFQELPNEPFGDLLKNIDDRQHMRCGKGLHATRPRATIGHRPSVAHRA